MRAVRADKNRPRRIRVRVQSDRELQQEAAQSHRTPAIKQIATKMRTGEGVRTVRTTMAITANSLTSMKFDTGFDIDFDLFRHSDQIFIDILQLCEDQHLKKFITSRIKLPATDIKEWVFTLTSPDADTITGTISGTLVTLNPGVLSEIFGLINVEDDIELDGSEYDNMLSKMGHSAGNPNKLLKKNLSVEHKFLADVVGKILLGKHTAHDYITKHQFLVMCALVNKKQEKAHELLVSSTVFINASKRLASALFGKWERTISKPSRASSSSTASESTRAVPATPQPIEEVPIPPPPSSTLLPTTPSPQQPPASPMHQPTPPASPEHITPPSSQLPHHLDDIPLHNLMSLPSFDLLPSSPHHIPSSPDEIMIDTLPLTSSSIIQPSVSTQTPPEFMQLDSPSISNILELISPIIRILIAEAITPLADSISSLSALFAAAPSVPSSRGLVPNSGSWLDWVFPSTRRNLKITVRNVRIRYQDSVRDASLVASGDTS
ncbi:hypothetical protein KSP39_PZI012530 [Platanthera zijinensis]|uniref:Uncharacterized protein n=1 Tax=Platanthera zijinensis TaxID=2320716 RepID=A0AAP0G4R7_9ASPA